MACAKNCPSKCGLPGRGPNRTRIFWDIRNFWTPIYTSSQDFYYYQVQLYIRENLYSITGLFFFADITYFLSCQLAEIGIQWPKGIKWPKMVLKAENNNYGNETQNS